MRHIRVKEEWISAISRNEMSKIRDLHGRHGDELLQVQSQSGVRPTGLHIACEYGYLDAVKFLVEKGADGLALDEDAKRPIHYAISNGNLPIVQYLHEKDCGFHPIPSENDSIFENHHWKESHFASVAIRVGTLPVLKYLIKHGVSVPASALYDECGRYSYLRIVKFLFSGTDEEDDEEQQHRHNLRRKKIKRDPMDGDGESDDTSSLLPCFHFDSMEGVNALRAACFRGDRGIANYLIRHGVDVNKIGDLEFDHVDEELSGYPTLTLACRHLNLLETVRLLLNHGADINARAPRSNRDEGSTDDDEDADSIEEADVDSSPLAAALSCEDEDIAACLLQDFGDRLVVSSKEMPSYLMLAAKEKGEETMRLLCQRLASTPDTIWAPGGKDRRNPLMTAIKYKKMEVIKLLCTEYTTAENRKDRLDMMDSAGDTALSIASRNGYVEGVHYLYNNGASVHSLALKRAIGSNRYSVMKFLCEETTVLDNGGVIDDENPGRTVLHVAANESFDILHYLCENHHDKIDFNSQDNETGRTVLHEVAEDSWDCDLDDSIMRLLLSKGANPNLQDSAGCTPLHLALEVYRFCLTCDEMETENLEYTCRRIRALLEANANPLCVNRYGRTPLQLAIDIDVPREHIERFQEVFDRLSLGLVYDILRAGGHHGLNRVCKRSSRGT